MTRLLVLVPTSFELQFLQPALDDAVRDADGIFAVCGFGPIASGIITTQLLAKHAPGKVVVVGIAGALNSSAAVGTADMYSKIGCYGIGAGSGSGFQTAGDLGWSQWIDPESGVAFGDTIQLSQEQSDTSLLTVCATSASAADVADRLQKFPDAVAEDMEAFAVAMACRMARIPLVVIRGISNVAGDRNKANWKIDAALKAAAKLVMSGISE